MTEPIIVRGTVVTTEHDPDVDGTWKSAGVSALPPEMWVEDFEGVPDVLMDALYPHDGRRVKVTIEFED